MRSPFGGCLPSMGIECDAEFWVQCLRFCIRNAMGLGRIVHASIKNFTVIVYAQWIHLVAHWNAAATPALWELCAFGFFSLVQMRFMRTMRAVLIPWQCLWCNEISMYHAEAINLPYLLSFLILLCSNRNARHSQSHGPLLCPLRVDLFRSPDAITK